MTVVPLAGTWIETMDAWIAGLRKSVVPLAGTWIETSCNHLLCALCFVVPLAGTWIETRKKEYALPWEKRRSPCGNVD